MNPKMFASTFLLIFLAELGDKTQLAAMARAATSESARWVVFVAASAALVLSTLLAVLLGGTLTRLVPERVIKLCAGVLFIVFGLLILREALVTKERVVRATRGGAVAAFVFRQAAAFERGAFEDYSRLAAEAEDPELRSLLEALAREEEAHFQTISAVDASGVELPEGAGDATRHQRLVHDVAKTDRPVLEHAIEHERATAGFYEELSRLTPVPALRDAFGQLARAERTHLARLEAFKQQGNSA